MHRIAQCKVDALDILAVLPALLLVAAASGRRVRRAGLVGLAAHASPGGRPHHAAGHVRPRGSQTDLRRRGSAHRPLGHAFSRGSGVRSPPSSSQMGTREPAAPLPGRRTSLCLDRRSEEVGRRALSLRRQRGVAERCVACAAGGRRRQSAWSSFRRGRPARWRSSGKWPSMPRSSRWRPRSKRHSAKLTAVQKSALELAVALGLFEKLSSRPGSRSRPVVAGRRQPALAGRRCRRIDAVVEPVCRRLSQGVRARCGIGRRREKDRRRDAQVGGGLPAHADRAADNRRRRRGAGRSAARRDRPGQTRGLSGQARVARRCRA